MIIIKLYNFNNKMLLLRKSRCECVTYPILYYITLLHTAVPNIKTRFNRYLDIYTYLLYIPGHIILFCNM